MPRVNYIYSNHLTPPRPRFLPFIEAMDRQRLVQLRAAMTFIEQVLVNPPCRTCEQSFRALPEGRGFVEIWNDPDVWISYTTSISIRGITLGKDVAISLTEFDAAPAAWRGVAATLIHELAHVAGAPGTTMQAEDTLRNCRFADQHRSIVG